MTEITCKSYATYSILFSKAIFTQWILHVEIKLNLCRNATGLPGEILKCNSLYLKFFEIDTLYSRKIALWIWEGWKLM